MIISAPTDFREAARRRLPRFLYDYIDAGAFDELTYGRNTQDFQDIELRQRVLRGVEPDDLSVHMLGRDWALPLALCPVGLTGMYARRGERQVAQAADKAGIPYAMSTVSICSIEEASRGLSRPIWFQLYVLRDRGFMTHVLDAAKAAGVTTLVFTVDLPVTGIRYKDKRSGLTGPWRRTRRFAQALTRPHWAVNVGLGGRPHTLGNISDYQGKPTGLLAYKEWLSENFDPTITWKDLEWIRDYWDGALVLKGILDAQDIPDALRLGADGIIVSNHGGRQLDGASSSIRALPSIVEAVDGKAKVLMDGGIRSGLDVVKALCLGADAAMIGRSYIYALAARGEAGITELIDMYTREMKVVMTLIGAGSITELDRRRVASLDKFA